MLTTIQISENLKKVLVHRKISSKDTYEEVIQDLLDNTLELNNQTKKEISLARKEFSQGKFVLHSEVKKELGL